MLAGTCQGISGLSSVVEEGRSVRVHLPNRCWGLMHHLDQFFPQLCGDDDPAAFKLYAVLDGRFILTLYI